MSLTPEELEKQINAALAQDQKAKNSEKHSVSKDLKGMNKGLRAGSELLGAVIVGAVLGYWLDRFLGTTPLFMIILLFIGFITGFYNIYRLETRPKNGKR
jgi:ATP synthase protein I